MPIGLADKEVCMKTRRRLPWGTIVRWTVCILAVSYIIRSTEWDQLRQAIAAADRRLAFFSILAFAPAPLFLAIRLKWLLVVNDVHLSVWEAIKVTFAGNFIINALPVGTSGGDAVKAYYIARTTHLKHEAVTTVFFDRVVGVVSLLVLSGVVVIIDWRNPAFAAFGQAIGIMVLALAVGSCVYFSYRLRRLLRLNRLVERLPLSAHIQRVDRAVFAFRYRASRVLAALLMTVVMQTICVISMFLVGWALGMLVDPDRPLTSLPIYLAYTPVCFLAGALPFGVKEGMFVALFADAAKLGTPEAALVLALASRIIELIWALPGALVVLKAGRPDTALLETTDVDSDNVSD
jgi:uncharacterized protein (TIRG00374 family)